MSMCPKSAHPVLAIAVDLTQSITAHRFVSFSGELSANETKAVGISEVAWLSGDKAAITVYGLMPVLTAEAIAIGQNVTSAADGKAKVATGTMPVNGVAVDSAPNGGYIKVLLMR